VELIKIAKGKKGEEKRDVKQRDTLAETQSSLAVHTEATAKQIVLIRSSRYLLATKF